MHKQRLLGILYRFVIVLPTNEKPSKCFTLRLASITAEPLQVDTLLDLDKGSILRQC